MLDGPLVFVDIDTQRDFLDNDGALPVPGSSAILPQLARLTEFARRQGIPVLATACAHTLDELDPEPFPPHCLVGTPGEERVEATAWPGSLVVGPGERFEGDPPPHLTLQKQRYDLFSHPDADRIIARYSRDQPTFIVYGVATDYCVRAAVLGLRSRGYRVVVVSDAVRAVDPSREAEVLEEFKESGASMASTDLVCGVK
ncbi:MAG: isochorismatase family cysteine hydrolase [Isosphaeraceae bacterium]